LRCEALGVVVDVLARAGLAGLALVFVREFAAVVGWVVALIVAAFVAAFAGGSAGLLVVAARSDRADLLEAAVAGPAGEGDRECEGRAGERVLADSGHGMS